MQRVASLEEAMTAIEQGTVAMAMLRPTTEDEVRPVVEPLAQRWPKLPLLVWGEDRARPAQAALRAGAWAYLSSLTDLEQMEGVPRPSSAEPPAPLGDDLTLAAAERLAIQRALEASAGNVKRAAKTLGIARATLYRKMARFGLRT